MVIKPWAYKHIKGMFAVTILPDFLIFAIPNQSKISFQIIWCRFIHFGLEMRN